MRITGERHVLTQNHKNLAEYYNHLMHLATYHYAEKLVANKKVLDFGCGSGYGAFLLSNNAKLVVGCDISDEAVNFSKENYPKENLIFKRIDQLGDETFDVITSFQVIEHVENEDEYLQNIKRHLSADGIVLISTPNREKRLYFFQKPWNIFHLREYTAYHLKRALTEQFGNVKILKITANEPLVMSEISRTLKQRRITLPATLPFYPNFLRVALLKLQARIFETLKKMITRKPAPSEDTSELDPDFISRYTVDNIRFEENPKLSSDLLAICNNT